MMDWQTTVVGPMEEMWTRMLVFLPKLLLIIIVLIVGWIVASLLEKIITRFFKLARLDSLSEKIGIANILTKGDINYTLSEIIGVLIYWVLMLVVVLLAVNALGLNVAADLLQRAVCYIPTVITGLFALVLGIFLASVASNAVRTAAANAGIRQARPLGQFTQTVIIILAAVEALNQLKIDTTVMQYLIVAVLAALSLGVGLAIGLGCKDMAARYVADLIENFKPRK